MTEALHRLRSEGWTTEELDARSVKAMITMVSKEKVLYGRKDPKAKAKAKMPPKSTAYPANRTEVTAEEEEDLEGVTVVQEPAPKR